MSVMRSPPTTSLPSGSVSNVVRKMIAFDIGAVIVSDGDKHYGLVTERDVLERVFEVGKDPTKTLAKEIMSSPLITVQYNKSLTDMLKIMHDKQIRRLAVIKEGGVIGIVTERRILEALIQ